jgi:hypothetical protein
MKGKTAHKCLHCREFYAPDYRKRSRQRQRAKPAFRKVSKAQSQRQWLAQAGNKNYFQSPDHSDRVKAWRREHPGYWRKKKAAGGVAKMLLGATNSTRVGYDTLLRRPSPINSPNNRSHKKPAPTGSPDLHQWRLLSKIDD